MTREEWDVANHEALRTDLIACYVAGPGNDERAKVHLRAMLVLIDEREAAAAEIARLRAEVERLNRLAWGAVANVRARRVDQPRWSLVMTALGIGSTRAHEVCREHGFDPDEVLHASLDGAGG